jgi:hypothetical protein
MIGKMEAKSLESSLFIRRISCLYSEGIPAVSYLSILTFSPVEDSTSISFIPFITSRHLQSYRFELALVPVCLN